MGCVFSAKKETLSKMQPIKTVNGLLKVTIQEACIEKPPSKLFSMDPYLKIRMSNQQYRGFVHKKAGRLDLFNESFQFIINSCYKIEGRSVSIEVWNKHIMGDKMIGMGAVDIQPIITFDQKNLAGNQIFHIPHSNQSSPNIGMQRQQQLQQSRACRCKKKLNLKRGTKQVGYINTMLEFIQQPITVVGLKFLYASLRRRSSSMIISMNVRIQVVAGEQVLSTQTHKDNGSRRPPSWEDEILLFNVPRSLKECIIRVLDDDEEVGRIKLKFADIIGREGEHKFTEQLHVDHKVVGVVKFIALVGLHSIISDSKKLLQKQESQQRQRQKQQIQRQFNRKIQSFNQKKPQIQQERTNFQTQPNEQQSSRYNGRLSTSFNFMDSQNVRQE